MITKSFASIEQAFIYYTNCQVATVYEYFSRKSQSQSSKTRQLGITYGMVAEVSVMPYSPQGNAVIDRWKKFCAEFSLTETGEPNR